MRLPTDWESSVFEGPMISAAAALLNVAPSPGGRLSELKFDVADWLGNSGDVNERDMEGRLRVFDATAKPVFSPFNPCGGRVHIQVFLLRTEVFFSRKLSSTSTVSDSFVRGIPIELGHMSYILTLNVPHCLRAEGHYRG